MRFFKPFAVLLLVLATQVPALCGEVAVLRNEHRISFNHKEEMGNLTRLYMGQDSSSFLDVQSDSIASFEKEDTPPDPAITQTPVSAAAAIQPAAPANSGKVVLTQEVAKPTPKRRTDRDSIN